MLTLDIRQHQGLRNPIEHVCRGRAAASLFEPCVPGRLILARCATSSRRRPGVRRRSDAKPNAAGSSFARRSFR